MNREAIKTIKKYGKAPPPDKAGKEKHSGDQQRAFPTRIINISYEDFDSTFAPTGWTRVDDQSHRSVCDNHEYWQPLGLINRGGTEETAQPRVDPPPTIEDLIREIVREEVNK